VPLTWLLKKDAFKWDKYVESFFEKLKTLITSPLILTTPNFSKTFILQCDASRTWIGVVLMQDNHPISFEIRKFKPNELTKSVYDK